MSLLGLLGFQLGNSLPISIYYFWHGKIAGKKKSIFFTEIVLHWSLNNPSSVGTKYLCTYIIVACTALIIEVLQLISKKNNFRMEFWVKLYE